MSGALHDINHPTLQPDPERFLGVKAFIFQCNSGTYLDCIEKSLFASNKPWPLEIREGDYCLLHHYEIGSLLGLWKAATTGGRNLVPKIWGGKFPFQAKVTLVVPKIAEVPRKVLLENGIDAAVGRFDDCVEGDLANALIQSMLVTTGQQTP